MDFSISISISISISSVNVLDYSEMSLTWLEITPHIFGRWGINCRWANPNSHWCFGVVWNLSLKKTSSLKHFFCFEFWVVSDLALESGRQAGKKSKRRCASDLSLGTKSETRQWQSWRFAYDSLLCFGVASWLSLVKTQRQRFFGPQSCRWVFSGDQFELTCLPLVSRSPGKTPLLGSHDRLKIPLSSQKKQPDKSEKSYFVWELSLDKVL